MSARGHTRATYAALAIALVVLAAHGLAQQPSHGPVPLVPSALTPLPAEPAGQPVTLDRVVAIVNGDLILDSDVDAEVRFAAFQPFNEARAVTRDQLVDRLIDRALIMQQMALQPELPITDEQVDAQLGTLRKSIPKCAAYHCETDAGWETFVADQDFTINEMRDRWRQRMTVLRFIEDRFRMGIRVEQADVDDYYKNRMLPVYKSENVTPPAEATIADRIQEIVLQQRVNKLLDDWLTALRAQGGVRIMKSGEEAP
jgi:peptidyl-prolyl cis-trans isomerase SurA